MMQSDSQFEMELAATVPRPTIVAFILERPILTPAWEDIVATRRAFPDASVAEIVVSFHKAGEVIEGRRQQLRALLRPQIGPAR